MKKITDEIIEKFRKHLIDEEKSAATLEKYIRDITAFRVWLGSEQLFKAKVRQVFQNQFHYIRCQHILRFQYYLSASQRRIYGV